MKLIETGKLIARTVLRWTPAGRAYYAKRKAAQRADVTRLLLQNGPEILKKVHEAFASAGYKYYICDGTLLGIVREGGILKHDVDIDFTIPPGSASPEQVLRLVLGLEFKFFWAWAYEGKIANIAFVFKGVHVDFDFLVPEEGHWSQLNFTKLEGMEYDKDDRSWSVLACPMPIVENVQEFYADQLGMKLMVPENYDQYLSAEYGEWRVPDSMWREKNLTIVPAEWKLLPELGKRVDKEEILGLPK